MATSSAQSIPRILNADEAEAGRTISKSYQGEGGSVLPVHRIAPMTEAPVVLLDAGAVRGAITPAGDIRVFRGIPFAADTGGPNRWRPPQPVVPWTGTREALEPGLICPQPKAIIWPIKNPQGEDCLSLSVWTPRGAFDSGPDGGGAQPDRKSGFPILLWIHGGGFSTGAGSTIFFDGEELARLGAVVVTINYRLGPFGFLAHPALSAESPDRVSGNVGLLDQVAALEWVQRNGAAFGGDPDCVTVFGESAGAASIARLLVSPRAAGLFHRAILQSGHARGRNRRLREDVPGFEAAETVGARIGANLNCEQAATRDATTSDHDIATLTCMRNRSPTEILAAANPAQGLYGGGIKFAPIVDGVVLPEDPERAFAAGRFHRVPILLGTNADEGSIFTEATRITTKAAFDAMLRRRFGACADEAARLYAVSNDAEVEPALVRLITDASFIAPARELARQTSAAAPGNTWMYHFSRVSPAGRKNGRGAFHAAEVSYVFNRVANTLAYDDTDRELARAMSRAWVDFARTGRAGWAPYDPHSESYCDFGDTVSELKHLRQPECDLIDRVMAARGSDGEGE
jgi:para-nitrobenzyl esterase